MTASGKIPEDPFPLPPGAPEKGYSGTAVSYVHRMALDVLTRHGDQVLADRLKAGEAVLSVRPNEDGEVDVWIVDFSEYPRVPTPPTKTVSAYLVFSCGGTLGF